MHCDTQGHRLLCLVWPGIHAVLLGPSRNRLQSWLHLARLAVPFDRERGVGDDVQGRCGVVHDAHTYLNNMKNDL